MSFLKKIQSKLVIPFFILIALFTINNSLLIHPAYAADCDPNCPAGLDQIEAIFSNVVSVVVYLGFIVMLVLIVTAGFKYLTSGGEPKAIQSAHSTMTWALLGIVFFAIAWIILQLVQAFTGLPVTFFNIKTL